MKYINTTLFLIFFNAYSSLGTVFKHLDIKKTQQEYQKLHHDFFKKACQNGADHRYQKLLKVYRGSGYYLPSNNSDIDIKVIKKNLPLIKEKMSWQKKQLEGIRKSKFPKFEKISQKLKSNVDALLEMKKEYQLALSSSERQNYLLKSRTLLRDLKTEFDIFLNKIPFLLSFGYPVDHLENRKSFDKYKSLGKKYKHKANDIFFQRKIYEDGAQDPNHSRSDGFLRSTIDTVFLEMKTQKDFISENLRYDLEYILKSIKYVLGRGRTIQIKRQREWLARTQKAYQYYENLIKDSKEKSDESAKLGLTKTQLLMKKKAKSTYELKDFVLEKQAFTYDYWRQKSELMKAIFVIETILFNEVGDVDGPEALERDDVAQVVINRKGEKFYRTIQRNEALYHYLNKKLSDKEIQQEHWLNVLFKTAEFSFTFYYIPGVSHIFCPDMSRRGKKLRQKNIEIAIKRLMKPREEFKAIRYFSRASMRGRIDMTEIWSKHKAIPERAGKKIGYQGHWIKKYQRKKYTYLYSFIDPKNRQYEVLKFDEKYLVLRKEKKGPVFYQYRDPHLFTYFVKN